MTPQSAQRSGSAKRSESDGLIFFGATGDLAFKKIFPALHAMAKRGTLTWPVVGVARSGWTREQFVAHAKDSIAKRRRYLEKAAGGQGVVGVAA